MPRALPSLITAVACALAIDRFAPNSSSTSLSQSKSTSGAQSKAGADTTGSSASTWEQVGVPHFVRAAFT